MSSNRELTAETSAVDSRAGGSSCTGAFCILQPVALQTFTPILGVISKLGTQPQTMNEIDPLFFFFSCM